MLCSIVVHHPPLLTITISAVVFTYWWLPFPSSILQYESEFQYKNKLALGLSYWSSDWNAELSMQGAQVRSLVGELRSHMLLGTVGKKEECYWPFSSLYLYYLFYPIALYSLPSSFTFFLKVFPFWSLWYRNSFFNKFFKRASGRCRIPLPLICWQLFSNGLHAFLKCCFIFTFLYGPFWRIRWQSNSFIFVNYLIFAWSLENFCFSIFEIKKCCSDVPLSWSFRVPAPRCLIRPSAV